ncbi:hypothetical protein SAMN05443246_2757 [Paenibacillus sp. GP183]|jgi:hypothetical protein|nr:hypothetical protein SAMN05443246_2757 [Paenibacillus sp. GP183]
MKYADDKLLAGSAYLIVPPVTQKLILCKDAKRAATAAFRFFVAYLSFTRGFQTSSKKMPARTD